MSLTQQLINLDLVGPGQTAILKVPCGRNAPTYDSFTFELGGGLNATHIESVRGKIGAKIFYEEGTGTVMRARAAYLTEFNEATSLTVDFTNKLARNGMNEQLWLALPGHLLPSLTWEIKIAAGAPVGGTIKALCDYRPPANNGWIKKLLSTPFAFNVAGTEASPNVLQIPTGQNSGAKVLRMWIHESTAGAITYAELRGGTTVGHQAWRSNEERQQKRNGLTPQAGIFVLDFIKDGNASGLLDTTAAPDMNLRIAASQAISGNVYFEIADPIGRL